MISDDFNVFETEDGRVRSTVGGPNSEWDEVGVGDNDTDATAHLVLDLASRATQQGSTEAQAEKLKLALGALKAWEKRQEATDDNG